MARITAAIENGEHITIYGDYDVDGITSATIMKEALESIGADPEVYIPNRFTDGYGPNLAAYQRLANAGTQLLITTDNGIAGAEPIAWAMANGMDVVVTDHHELAPTLPEAVAVVHPRYPGSEYRSVSSVAPGWHSKLRRHSSVKCPLKVLTWPHWARSPMSSA